MHATPQHPPTPCQSWETTFEQAARRKRAGAPVWEWFDQRVRTHHEAMAALPSTRVPQEALQQKLHEALYTRQASRPRVLYIHVPFCKRICTFCNFFRQPCGDDTSKYAEALCRQIERVAETPWAQARAFDAVYFGGGTPTALPARHLVEVVDCVCTRLPLAPNCEVTVESRFEGIDHGYLAGLRESGANRLSFGVQTFNTEIRRRVGRLADRETMLSRLLLAQALGFASVSVDLIYNLPGQTREHVAEDVRVLTSSGVTGASVYALIPFRGSALARAIEDGREAPLGDVAHEYHLHEQFTSALAEHGAWTRMSPFHYGQPGIERNVYNGVRMLTSDILGLGCGAGGDLNGLSYMHAMDIARYIADSEELGGAFLPTVGGSMRPIFREDNPAPFRVFSGEGIARGDLNACAPKFAHAAYVLVELGLLDSTNGWLRLTTDGCFWAYNLIAAMSQAIASRE